MPSYRDLLKYAHTGIASPDMTYRDMLRARAIGGGFPVQTITGVPPISFIGDGTPLISVDVLGNGRQTGTPSPQNIIMPDLVGVLDGANWKIPITCAGQTVPVYLGQTQTVRKIYKLVLTGNEEWDYTTSGLQRITISENLYERVLELIAVCSHYEAIKNKSSVSTLQNNQLTFLVSSSGSNYMYIRDPRFANIEDFKSYLAQQYAAGTPVTIWYVLATEQTGIVNEPLCKIGDYADELHSADAAVTIPTAKGANVLTVDTDLPPSSVSITGHIK